MAKKVLRKLSTSKVTTFKIRNRRGYAAIYAGNLTEGNTVGILTVIENMTVAL